MTAGILRRDGATLSFADEGEGLAVVFQHGLGGDRMQAEQSFPAGPGLRRLTLDCRGHGGSSTGSARPFSLALFADDVLAAVDIAGIDRFVAGGISMGAAIAMRLAVRHPDRVCGLVLVRPAWTFAPAPSNMQLYAEVARAIRSLPRDAARDAFAACETADRLRREAPDNLASLLGFFDRPDAAAFAEILKDIAADGPEVTKADAAAIRLPVLVVGNRRDAAHPIESARALAEAFPHADFVEVVPKGNDRDRHLAETKAAIAAFLSPLKHRSAA